MSRRFGSGCALLLFLLFLAGAHAQQTGGADTTIHLQGTVVNGVTGKPLSRALVSSVDQRFGTLTNVEGRFSFEITLHNLAAQNPNARSGTVFWTYFMLRVQKPGFVFPDEMLPVQFTPETAAQDLHLTLMPSAAINGRVFADTTDAPADVPVLLLKRQPENGYLDWTRVGMQRTNGQGEFHFSNLRPGEYTVTTAEWRGDDPLPLNPRAVTEQYPPDFAGDVPHIDSATKVRLHYGELTQFELHLHRSPYFPVVLPVTADSGNVGGVNVRFTGTDSFNVFQLGYNARDHAVEGSLPNGDYSVLVSSFGPQQAFGLASLHIAGAPLHAAPVVLAHPAAVTVHVHRELIGPNTPEFIGLNLLLRPEDKAGGYLQGSLRPNAGDDFLIENPQPGRYRVQTMAPWGYVASITSAGHNLFEEPFVISPNGSADPIEVTLRDDVGSISGIVHSETALPPQTIAVLLPRDPGGQIVTGALAPDGSFTLPRVWPGSYRLLATSNRTFQFPFRDPESMRSLDSKTTSLTVAPGQKLQADANFIPASALDFP